MTDEMHTPPTEQERAKTPSAPLERVRAERDAAEQRAERAEAIVAALIRKYGEPVRLDLAWRASLTESELVTHGDGLLRVMVDPNSGAMLLRYEDPL